MTHSAKQASSYAPRWQATLLFGALLVAAGVLTGNAVTYGPLGAAVILALLGGGAIALGTFSAPWIGVSTLVFVTYIRLSDVLIHYHNLPSIAKPLVALLLGVAVLRWVLHGEEPRGWGLPLALIGSYALVILLSLFFAANFGTALDAVGDFVKDGVIAVLVVMLFQHRDDLPRVIWALLFAGILMGSLSVYQYVRGDFGNDFGGFAQAPVLNIVGEHDKPRIAGPIGDPNFYAHILVALFPLALNRLFAERRLLGRILALWAAVVIVLSVVFTFSRGGFLALAVVVAALAVHHKFSPTKVLAVFILAAVLFPFLPGEYTARLSTLTDFLPGRGDVRNEVSFRGRASEWIVAGLMFLDHPLLGVGVRNYPEHYLDYSSRLGLDPRRENREPHSFYLEIAAESGLAGILVFAAIFVSLYRAVRTARQRFEEAGAQEEAEMTVAFGLALLGYLTAALFIHAAFPRYFWLLTGIGLALPQAAQSLRSTNRPYARFP